MKIINTKTGLIYNVVDTTPDQSKMEIHKGQAELVLRLDHRDDGGKWAEVEEVKPKRKPRKPRKKAPPKEETQ